MSVDQMELTDEQRKTIILRTAAGHELAGKPSTKARDILAVGQWCDCVARGDSDDPSRDGRDLLALLNGEVFVSSFDRETARPVFLHWRDISPQGWQKMGCTPKEYARNLGLR